MPISNPTEVPPGPSGAPVGTTVTSFSYSFNRAVFYFDVSNEQAHILGTISAVLPKYGAVHHPHFVCNLAVNINFFAVAVEICYVPG